MTTADDTAHRSIPPRPTTHTTTASPTPTPFDEHYRRSHHLTTVTARFLFSFCTFDRFSAGVLRGARTLTASPAPSYRHCLSLWQPLQTRLHCATPWLFQFSSMDVGRSTFSPAAVCCLLDGTYHIPAFSGLFFTPHGLRPPTTDERFWAREPVDCLVCPLLTATCTHILHTHYTHAGLYHCTITLLTHTHTATVGIELPDPACSPA